MTNSTTYIARVFLQFLFTVRMYHWSTNNYARHKASDFLYTKVQEQADKFIETMTIRYGRVTAGNDKVSDETISAVEDTNVIDLLKTFCNFLNVDIPNLVKETDTDLLSIRDEILAITQQTLYLFTLE